MAVLDWVGHGIGEPSVELDADVAVTHTATELDVRKEVTLRGGAARYVRLKLR